MTETVGAWGDGGHHRPPSAVSSSVEAPLGSIGSAGGTAAGADPRVGRARSTPLPTGRDTGSNPVPGDNAPAASTAWSRVITVGVNSCDGYPRCQYEGTGRDLKLHKRECPFSDAGAFYRVFRGAGYR